MQGSPEDDRPRSLSRRTVVRGAAGVAGAAWLVPVVTVVSMDSASAASAPPPGGGEASAGGRLSGQGSQANSTLAFTGSDASEAAIVGAATLATGAAAIVAARRLRRTDPDAVPPPGRHRGEGDTP